jgi:DNA-binding transcriptional MerR regulator
MEYTASDLRKILQQIFPHRRLVLSQFTFFNQIGVARPTGESFRRGRRCYRLTDMLSIATVLALKEEGIPLKNIQQVPALLQEQSERIFATGAGCRLSGCGDEVALQFPGESVPNSAVDLFLGSESATRIFWGYDVGLLARQLENTARGEVEVRKAA